MSRRSTILALLLTLLPVSTWAACPSTPNDCPSPTYKQLFVGPTGSGLAGATPGTLLSITTPIGPSTGTGDAGSILINPGQGGGGGTDRAGGSVTTQGGAGSGASGAGGSVSMVGGDGSGTGAAGSGAVVGGDAGSGTATGGGVTLVGGHAGTTGGTGGAISVLGGDGGSAGTGGDVHLVSGSSVGGQGGDMQFGLGTGATRNGLLRISGIPTTDPAVSNAIWQNSAGALVMTGHTGAPTSVTCAALPALTGDTTTSAGSCATSTTKIGGDAVSLAGAFTTSGTGTLTFMTSGDTTLTLPTTGTLQTTAGASGIVNSATSGQVAVYNGATSVFGSSNFMYSAGTVTLGSASGTTTGILSMHGSASGAVAIQTQATAGTYNFNLPTTAGTAGQAFLSGGGGSNPMTFGTLGVAAGGTGATSLAAAGIAQVLSATTAAIGGGLLVAGACTSGTVSVTGSTTAMAVIATPVTYPGDGTDWKGYVSTGGTVTVKVCALVAVTPTSTAYNVRVIQ